MAWWGWKSGAYFRVTFLPGTIVLLGLGSALLLYAPWPLRVAGPARLALASLLALAGWTLLSAVWSPTSDVAVADATRVAVYALVLVLAIWLCLLLGRQMLLALSPVAAASAVVAVGTLLVLWTGSDVPELLDEEGTLRYPLGYRNAVGAFFLTGVLASVVLAASRELDWRLRAALLSAAALGLELVVLAQSRGAVFAAAVALAVLVAAHPQRLRILGWLCLAAVPAALAVPWLLEVFQRGGGNTAESLSPLRGACAAMAVTTALAAALGAVAARGESRVALSDEAARRLGATLLGGLGVLLLIGAVALARAEGGPVGFLARSADQLTAGSPDLEPQGTRFGLDVRTDRGDLWRVAVDDLGARPLTGEGAGGFRFSYLRDRETHLQPEDPHSVELLMASELGLPGVALFAVFMVTAVAAALRARRLGPSAAVLVAGALAIASYWLVHASVEWFWSYPSITLPAIFVLGAAAAPGLLHPGGGLGRTQRRSLAAGAGVAAVALLPFFFADRYTNQALRHWEGDLAGAYSSLERAADLNPLSDRALAAEAVIAEEAGEPQRALGALSRAQERVPDEWTLYYLEARILVTLDPASASRALERVRALNPHGPEADRLEAELGPPR